MIEYSAIASKVWRSVSHLEAGRNRISTEEIGYLDYQVIQWNRSIPDYLKYIHPGSGQDMQPSSRGNHRLRILLYLRANQMRILIYRPVLHTTTNIMENITLAHTVVDVAKDTIRVLTHTHQTTDVYRSHEVMFNYFLISALAVLFLAVSHAPAEFSESCRDEFYMCLDLVRGLSADSYISKRLWKTIRHLKEIGPRLGLRLQNDPTATTADPHSSAAVAMAGLAGHNVDESAFLGNGLGNRGLSLGESPNGMANDLTNLFEAIGAYAGVTNGYGPPVNGVSSGAIDVTTGAAGTDDELSKILRELF